MPESKSTPRAAAAAASPSTHPTGPSPRLSRPRQASFRFSLRLLLILVTAIAILTPLVPVIGAPLAGVLMPWITNVAAPVCLATAAAYCRGRRQTFFLGAAILSLFGQRAVTLASGYQSLLWAAERLAGYAAGGGLALATRVFVESKGWHLPPHRDDPTREQ